MRKRGRDLENRVHGTMAEVREMWSGREHYVDAKTLVDQVRTTLGRSFGTTLEHVNLSAVGHTIYAHGYVKDADERERLMAAIRATDGVEDLQASELYVQPELPEAPPAVVPETDAQDVSAPAPHGRPQRRRQSSS